MAKLAGITVVFDLDGTLVDTALDIHAAANLLLSENDLPALELAEVRGLIGGGPTALVTKAFANVGQDIDGARLAFLVERFKDLYAANIACLSRPFPGVEAALDELAASGAMLAICTNKTAGLTLALLDALGLSKRFHAIVTPETAGAAKPDPAHLLTAIAQAGGSPDQAVMVGDSRADAAAARAAGVALILVDFGYCEETAVALEPDVLIGHFDELAAAVVCLPRVNAKAIAAAPAMDA